MISIEDENPEKTVRDWRSEIKNNLNINEIEVIVLLNKCDSNNTRRITDY